MQAVLQFVKSYWISLVCLVAAAGFVTIGVMGMTSDAVEKAMKAELQRTGATNISGLMAQPQNESTIEKVRLAGQKFEEEYVKTVETAKAINRREPLMGGVFPKPANSVVPFEFQEAYAKAMTRLPAKMDAGTLPTDVEIREEQQNIEDLVQLEQERRAEEGVTEEPAAPVAPGRIATPQPTVTPNLGVQGARFGNRGGGSRMVGGRGAAGGSVAIPGGDKAPKYNPYYRARVTKAKNIRVYVEEGTFHASPLITPGAEAPAPEAMWLAQVGLWIQQDIVDAIATLNREAADRANNVDANVGDSPVKRLIEVRILGYDIQGQQREPFPSATSSPGNLPPQVNKPTFTNRKSNELYDVVRFYVSAVVDQREVLTFVDQICRTNLYHCVNIGYEQVDRSVDQDGQGYFYGPAPVVRVSLEFEGYMSREVYAEWMPEGIRALLGVSGGES